MSQQKINRKILEMLDDMMHGKASHLFNRYDKFAIKELRKMIDENERPK